MPKLLRCLLLKLDWCEETLAATGKPRSSRALRDEVSRRRNASLRLQTHASEASIRHAVVQIVSQPPAPIPHLPREAKRGRPDRRELLKLLKALAPCDVVTVTRIDRLARSTYDLFAIVKQIVDAEDGSNRLPSRGQTRRPAPDG